MFFKVMKKIKKKLFVAVIIDMLIALFLGRIFITTKSSETFSNTLKFIVVPLIYLMLISPMSNIDSSEIIKLKSKKIIIYTSLLNFTIPPALAYLVYSISGNIHLFIATLLLSLFPTGSMTLNFVHLCHGDEALAMATQILSLSMGAVLVSILLSILFAAKVSVLNIIGKVALVLLGPFLLSRIIRKKVKLNDEVMEKMRALSIFGMLSIIFISGFEKSYLVFEKIDYFLSGISYILVFYGCVLLTAFVSKKAAESKFGKKEGVTVFYTTFLKNITISLGLSALIFPSSIIYFVIAYIVQLPTASLFYHRFSKNTKF